MTLTRKKCLICGAIYYGGNLHKTGYCSDECRDEGRRRSYALRGLLGGKRKPSRRLDNTLKEINAYNKEHGTHLSYGQYQALKVSQN